jgi:hypothetical protein
VGGIFINVSGQAHTNIVRLNVDGSVDGAFAPLACGKHSSTSPTVYSLAVQSDGKILVGGDFPSLNGVAHTNLGRIDAKRSAGRYLFVHGG